MIDIASAGVTLEPTISSKFRRTVDREVGAAGDSASTSFTRRFSRRADSEGQRLGRGFGKAFAAGAAVAFGAGVFLKGAIDKAGQLEQSVGAIGTVFKRSATRMLGWSRTAAKSVGLASNEFNELGTLIGSQLKNGGTAMDDLAPKTKKLIVLGADLSSMFGGTTKEAVEALSSALKGERDPIERYGVTLNQSKIDAEAAALGFKKVDNALSSQAQQAATLSLIYKQTTDAQGNFAKESNTLAGKQQRLTARMENLRAAIGTALLPVMVDLADFTDKQVVPVIEKASRFLNENRDEIRATAKEWGGRFFSAVEDIWNLLKPLLVTLNAIPGPLKEMVLQGTLLSVALKKIGVFSLTSSLATLGTTAATTAAQTDQATKSVSRFGLMARNVAGVGGLLALTQASSQSNDAVGGLMNVMGGAGVGFMLAGPWGALAGAVGGAGKALWDTERAMAQTVANAQTLNGEVSKGIATRLKREADEYLNWALTLNNGGNVTLDTIRKIKNEITTGGKSNSLLVSLEAEMKTLGLTSGTVTKAMTGNAGAMREVALAMVEADNAKGGVLTFNEAIEALKTDAQGIASLAPHVQTFMLGWTKNRAGLDSAQKNVQGVHRATKSFRDSVREPIRTLFRTNAPTTTVEIAKVARQYKLTPKEIRSVIRLSGQETSVKHIKALISQLAGIAPEAKKSGEKSGKGLSEGTGKGVKASRNLWIGPYKKDLLGGGGAKPDAARGGKGIGNQLASGTALGISQGIPWVEAAARSMAYRAKVAAESELQIKSPSRVFFGIGRNTVVGFVRGVTGTAGRAEKAIRDMLTRINQAVKKQNLGKTMAAQLRQSVAAISKESSKLRRLLSARNNLASTISSNLRGEFNLSELAGKNEFGISLGAGAATKAAQGLAARMKAFGAKLTALVKAGMPGALVQEIAGYGSAEGSRVADVFLSATKAEMSSLKSSFASFNQYASSAGLTAANATYGGRIEAQQDRLEEALERGLAKMGMRAEVVIGKRTQVAIYRTGKRESERRG